jgi:hypothetical protein
MLVHSLQELSDSWANQDKDIAHIALDFYWQDNIRVLYGFE